MLSLFNLQTHFDAIAADDFENILAKGEIVHLSPSTTTFSTIKLSFIEIVKVFVTMFSKSSAAELLYMGKG